MTLRLIAILCAAAIAGCGTTPDSETPAERRAREDVTGSNIKKKVRPGDYAGMDVGDREAMERELGKAAARSGSGGGGM